MSRSRKKCWWKCFKKQHEWEAVVSNRSSGTGCPYCIFFKHEAECRTVFEKLFNKPFRKTRAIFGNQLELDGYCEELKLAFEYNGIQHYERLPHWQKTSDDFLKQQKRDIKKARLCKEKGIRLITIPYTENHRLEEFIRENCGLH